MAKRKGRPAKKKKSALARRIQAKRRRLELTQQQLADRLGIPYGSIIAWENDQRTPSHAAMKFLKHWLSEEE